MVAKSIHFTIFYVEMCRRKEFVSLYGIFLVFDLGVQCFNIEDGSFRKVRKKVSSRKKGGVGGVSVKRSKGIVFI